MKNKFRKTKRLSRKPSKNQLPSQQKTNSWHELRPTNQCHHCHREKNSKKLRPASAAQIPKLPPRENRNNNFENCRLLKDFDSVREDEEDEQSSFTMRDIEALKEKKLDSFLNFIFTNDGSSLSSLFSSPSTISVTSSKVDESASFNCCSNNRHNLSSPTSTIDYTTTRQMNDGPLDVFLEDLSESHLDSSTNGLMLKICAQYHEDSETCADENNNDENGEESESESANEDDDDDDDDDEKNATNICQKIISSNDISIKKSQSCTMFNNQINQFDFNSTRLGNNFSAQNITPFSQNINMNNSGKSENNNFPFQTLNSSNWKNDLTNAMKLSENNNSKSNQQDKSEYSNDENDDEESRGNTNDVLSSTENEDDNEKLKILSVAFENEMEKKGKKVKQDPAMAEFSICTQSRKDNAMYPPPHDDDLHSTLKKILNGDNDKKVRKVCNNNNSNNGKKKSLQRIVYDEEDDSSESILSPMNIGELSRIMRSINYLNTSKKKPVKRENEKKFHKNYGFLFDSDTSDFGKYQKSEYIPKRDLKCKKLKKNHPVSLTDQLVNVDEEDERSFKITQNISTNLMAPEGNGDSTNMAFSNEINSADHYVNPFFDETLKDTTNEEREKKRSTIKIPKTIKEKNSNSKKKSVKNSLGNFVYEPVILSLDKLSFSNGLSEKTTNSIQPSKPNDDGIVDYFQKYVNSGKKKSRSKISQNEKKISKSILRTTHQPPLPPHNKEISNDNFEEKRNKVIPRLKQLLTRLNNCCQATSHLIMTKSEQENLRRTSVELNIYDNENVKNIQSEINNCEHLLHDVKKKLCIVAKLT
ncbi:hypothetical protein SNEBB_003030 [Seison nebaliae]|nr:hypothetical protein SNEBB_003030 [Seison nebaliae]